MFNTLFQAGSFSCARSHGVSLHKKLRPPLFPRSPSTCPQLTSTRHRCTVMSLPHSAALNMLSQQPYVAPQWAETLTDPPSHKYVLGQFPTPIHQWQLPGLPSGCELWVKRDDLSGMQLSGNKVRKLEFLLAEAKAQGCDCVITIGGVQSNHCRATAVAARYLGLDAYLILRTSKALVDEDPGLVGNLLVERLVGAQIEMVTRQEYVTLGSEALGQNLLARLKAEGRRPYLIPVGGSNALGSWGYLEAIAEVESQLNASHPMTCVDDIVLACGSGGTAAGLALGSHLSSLKATVHAYGVCDSPEYFYEYVEGLLRGMGSQEPSRAVVKCIQAKGSGYAISEDAELAFMQQVALSSGIVLDPVYSGKALYQLFQDMDKDPTAWEGRKVLFVHTGGLLGMYDKSSQLQPLIQSTSSVSRFPFEDALQQRKSNS